MENLELIQKFVDELESGNHSQTRHTLKRRELNGTFSYCCLGILTEKVLGRNVKAVSYENDIDEGSDKWYDLCRNTLRIDLRTDLTEQLTVMNDGGKTFEEIAQVIRDEYALKKENQK